VEAWRSSKLRFSLVSPQKDFVVAIRVERRVYVDEIDTAGRQFAKLIEIIAAVDNPRVEQRGRFCGH
jgi:hypothetical protein